MKQRPSFPAQLEATLAKTRPNPHGVITPTAVSPGKALPRTAPTPATVAGSMPLGVGMDSSAVRMRMVKKLAEQGVRDAMVLAAMGTVERHRFVDSALANQAYEDTSLPIGLGQTISKPGVVSRMAELPESCSACNSG